MAREESREDIGSGVGSPESCASTLGLPRVAASLMTAHWGTPPEWVMQASHPWGRLPLGALLNSVCCAAPNADAASSKAIQSQNLMRSPLLSGKAYHQVQPQLLTVLREPLFKPYSMLSLPSGAEALVHFAAFAARLKPCPFKTST